MFSQIKFTFLSVSAVIFHTFSQLSFFIAFEKNNKARTDPEVISSSGTPTGELANRFEDLDDVCKPRTCFNQSQNQIC